MALSKLLPCGTDRVLVLLTACALAWLIIARPASVSNAGPIAATHRDGASHTMSSEIAQKSLARRSQITVAHGNQATVEPLAAEHPPPVTVAASPDWFQLIWDRHASKGTAPDNSKGKIPVIPRIVWQTYSTNK